MIVFQVIEGKVKQGIRLHGMERLNDNYVIKRLAKDVDAPLDINQMREKFQLLLSDPLFERMNARLMPDTNPGEALLEIDVARARPYQITTAFDNYRHSFDRLAQEISVNGSVRNLTGYGDALQASMLAAPTSLNESGLHESLAWRMPLGYDGTDMSLAIDHGLSAVEQESLQALGIRSTLNSRAVGFEPGLDRYAQA